MHFIVTRFFYFIMEILTNLTNCDFIKLHQRFGCTKAIGRILAMVEETGCQTAIIEKEPDEKEFKLEYEKHYKNVFRVNSHNVERLHFFEGCINHEDEIKEGDSRYLGYCDIRPLQPPSVSGALIDQRVFIKKNNDFLFLVCKRKFNVSFMGKTLNIEAFPYLQQDGSVIRCAQAALTSISMYWGNDLRGPYFTELTKKIPTGNRVIPSSGMTGQQIGIALEELGKEAVLYQYLDDDNAKNVPLQHREQIIYRYLESGIPVIVGITTGSEMHALVIVGHTFTPDSWAAQTATSYFMSPKTGFKYHCCTNWIERFVVQDDNLGPYTLILSDFLQYYGCKLIAVGLPPGIFCMAEDAEAFVGDLLSPRSSNITATILDHYRNVYMEQKGQIHLETNFWYNEFRKHTLQDELVLRTYLLESDEWIRRVKTLDSYLEFENLFENLQLPERVWVVEISWPQVFGSSHKSVHKWRFW